VNTQTSKKNCDSYLDTLLRYIELGEGRRHNVYTDTAGHKTIGVGFNLDRKDARRRIAMLGLDYDQVRSGEDSLSDEEIDTLLTMDVGTAMLDAFVLVPGFDELLPARRVVLTDMAFNLGRHKLGLFKGMLKAVGDKHWVKASLEMKKSRWATQVGRRADRNMHGMLTGELLWE